MILPEALTAALPHLYTACTAHLLCLYQAAKAPLQCQQGLRLGTGITSHLPSVHHSTLHYLGALFSIHQACAE